MSRPSQAPESSFQLVKASAHQWLPSVEARLPFQTSDTAAGFATESHSAAELKDHELLGPCAPKLSKTKVTGVAADSSEPNDVAVANVTEEPAAFAIAIVGRVVAGDLTLQQAAVGRRNRS